MTQDSLDLQHCLQVAVLAARHAGAVIAAAFSAPKNVHHKGKVDLVTDTDRQAEELISARLRAAFPDHKFIGEEQVSETGVMPELTDEPTWMCDPLDGTTNFVHSFPFVCVSIGLCIKKQVVVGVVFNPVLNELFTAVRGGGAFLNGAPISVAEESDLGAALLATEIGTTRDAETVAAIFDRVQALTAAMRSVRCSGSCAMNLCGVACGRLDAFFEIGFGGCWDVAAGSLIVQEAGGAVMDPAGARFDVMGRRVLAGNPTLAPAVARVLAGCKTSSKEPPAPAADF